uniref:Serine aminopeptidase S33 domain-containing protein n=1 Tax=Helicotheca tamesis TaxID=374047 RepID=A0A7S2MT06_9STRA|eukprot:CAMPEP_0185741048 /NCGR_PEP_ID=MMETSP1171-20130828/38750_1 /TAXON_ID=374046 /ORGANISM="Helicotheca tamensis, Strain CCMP826" /LENGTH=337 /DNA_ID=CAMNT_0028412989 /DNA_START=84 /DNA_END=1097 /DNA_ORIENTATION=+
MANKKINARDIPETDEEKKLPKDLEVQYFTNRRSQSLRTVTMRARGENASSPKARVVFITGLTDHCTRNGYVYMYESLASAGADVHSIDLHGQGRSEGLPRSYCNKFDDHVDDAEEFVAKCRAGDDGKAPLIIMGQSMGALIAAHTALRLGNENVAGLVATSPAFGVVYDFVKKVQLKAVPVLDALMPKAKMVDAVRAEDLTRNKEEVEINKVDPLIVHGKTPVRTGRVIVNAMKDLKEKRSEIKCPVLLLHGTKDMITCVDSCVDFYKNVGTPKEKKCFLRCPGVYHELYNEPEKDIMVGEIVKFAVSGGTELPDKKDADADGIVALDFSSFNSSS